MMIPPSVVPWPPMNFVSEWITTSAPCSIGLSRNGVGDGVVGDHRDALCVGHVGDRGEVDDVAGGVPDGLAEDRLGALVDQCPDRIRAVVGREADLDPEPGKHVREIRVGGPVELRNRHEVVAGTDQVEHRHADRGRAGADRHRRGAALQRGDPLLEHVDRRDC